MGKLVHGVSLSHEDGWATHGDAMRQPGEEDEIQNIELPTIKYPTRTNRAEQNEVSWKQATPDSRTAGPSALKGV